MSSFPCMCTDIYVKYLSTLLPWKRVIKSSNTKMSNFKHIKMIICDKLSTITLLKMTYKTKINSETTNTLNNHHYFSNTCGKPLYVIYVLWQLKGWGQKQKRIFNIRNILYYLKLVLKVCWYLCFVVNPFYQQKRYPMLK